MKVDITIDIDEAFNSLSYMEQAECVSNFYDALPYNNQKKQFIAQVIENVVSITI